MTLQQRHMDTDKRLNKVAQKVINKNRLREISRELAPKYQVSSQTIINYIYGQGKDGFLKEALIADLS